MCDDDEVDDNVDVDVLTKWVAHLGGWLDQVAKTLGTLDLCQISWRSAAPRD